MPENGWMMEIAGGSAFPPGLYSMTEIDGVTCWFARPGGASFEMPAVDIVRHEQTGLFRVLDPLAANDNEGAAGGNPA